MGKTTGDASDGQRSHDDIAKMVTTMQYPYPYHQQRWAVSYSQPLAHGDEVGSAARRGAMRKHSLNEDCMVYSEPANPFFSAAHAHADNARSYSYPHHPNLPPPLPPHGARHDPSGPHFGGGGLPQLARMESRGPAALPEFIGRGGGTGVFKLPLRAAMLPGRPPPLELRPHPHRETQVGSFLRTIVCTPSQLWAGQESGVRFWSLSDLFNGWGGVQFSLTKVKLGDEESVPFRESFRTSPTLCLAVDAANRLVWSGHKDGKIRSWRMEQLMHLEIPPGKVGNATTTIATTANTFTDDANFKEGLSWHAHHGPVLSLVITSYGELWSGSEGGILKVWPWEAIEKSLSLSTGEKHMAALLVERSFVDLRSLITIGGVCSLPAIDIKYLLSDNSRSKVWSGSYLTFALWDSRTKELLKVFGIDGQIEARVDITPVQDPHIEDEMKMKFVSASKKEKSQLSFFQRSRNALMGAADAVRRVAVKGAFGDDNRRAEALAMSMDGMIWVGCTNGSLMQWDGNGNRLQEIHHLPSSVKSICAFGTQLWVGYANGIVQIMDLKGNLLGGWVAHSSPIIKMAFGGTYIFTLANHGGICGWYLASPGPLDSILMSELTNKKLLYTKLENLRILAGTWNVGQERASHDSLITWLGCAASEVGMVVVGLQEVEMGAGFLAMAAAKETVGLEGSANGQWWLDTIGKILDEGNSFDRVGSRQLAGLLIVVWARKYLRPYIGDVDAAAVPCGFGRAIGNKGAVGLRMRVYDRVMCFVNCHFAAHVEAVNRRNADFDHIYRTMAFSRPSSGHHAAACASSAVQSHHGVNATGIQSDDRKPELSEGDMVIFLGDFNYRLHSISYDEARDLVSQRSFDWLRDKDQLRAEMKAGNVFQGMREGQIKFPPTYKFERHQAGLSGYDSGEKKRIPAWCDRILYRDSRSLSTAQCSLDCPVVSSILEYDACIDVTGSDHKPVRCIFNVEIAHVDGLIRRQQYGAIVESNEEVRSLLEECCGVPETIVSTNDIILQNDDTSIIRISNKCKKGTAIYEITCKGQSTTKEEDQTSEIHPRCSFGFPRWLKVVPAVGVIKPGQAVEVSLHHEEVHALEESLDGIPQNWWCEYTRDMEVILLVSITGSSSTESTSHLIHVRHCFSSKASCSDSKGANRKVRRNLCHRSDITQFGGPSDMADLFRMHCP